MKGQTQAVTAVLITTVIIGAVATAYVWGIPLIEKQQSQSDLQQIETDALAIHREIISAAESGTGTATKTTLNTNDGLVVVNTSADYIRIRTSAPQTPYPSGSWTLLRGSSLQNLTVASGSYAIDGEDLPGVVMVKSNQNSGGAVIDYRIEFRNMKTSENRLKLIDLVSDGRNKAAGDMDLRISNIGSQTDTVQVSPGETLQRKRILIEVDLS